MLVLECSSLMSLSIIVQQSPQPQVLRTLVSTVYKENAKQILFYTYSLRHKVSQH